MDVRCGCTTEASHKNVVACGVSELQDSFPKVFQQYVYAST